MPAEAETHGAYGTAALLAVTGSDVARRTGPDLVHVFVWGASDFSGVGHDTDGARRRQTAFPGVHHVQPRQNRIRRRVRRHAFNSAPDVLVDAEVGTLPPIQGELAGRCYVVEGDDRLRGMILHDRGQRAI